MAEQSSRDVVDQTLSGGEPSPSDVPASTNDKQTAEGDAGEAKHIATTFTAQITSDQHTKTRDTPSPSADKLGDKDAGSFSMVGFSSSPRYWTTEWLNWLQDSPKQSAGLVASRALELNGLASVSDGGDDTASQAGSESDASRTDGRHHTRTGSVKKPTSFKPVSFAKFSVPKAPGTTAPPKAPEKGIFLFDGYSLGHDSDIKISSITSHDPHGHSAAYCASALSSEVHGCHAGWLVKVWPRRREVWWIRTGSEPSLE